MSQHFDARKRGTQIYQGFGHLCQAIYKGKCIVCGTSVFMQADEHNNGTFGPAFDPDPRGEIGMHSAQSLEAATYNMTGADVYLCARCDNDAKRQARGIEIAKKQWASPPDEQGQGIAEFAAIIAVITFALYIIGSAAQTFALHIP